MSISRLLAFKHGSTCSDDLNIPDSTNISGNFDLARKYLKLAPKSVCRIPTCQPYEVQQILRQTPTNIQTRCQFNWRRLCVCVCVCFFFKPSIHYSCCNHWSAKKKKYCVSHTACRIYCAKLGSGKTKTNQNICSNTQSQSLCSAR